MAFTIRDIGILFGYRVDKASENKVESSVQSLKSMASKALGAIGLTVSVSGIASAISSCVSLSSEVEEMENKFNVVFGNMSAEVDAWAQNYADAIGRNKNDIKTYLADQQNLLVGFGMTREAGAALSEQMTSLALDLASFGNLDETSAVNNMTDAVMGETEAAKSLGAILDENTRAQAMHTLGLTGTYESLDQVTKMQVNYQAILSQSADAVGDCERSMGSYASTLRGFQSRLKELRQLIGQFFMPAFQKALSFGTRGITVLRNIVQRVNDFAGKVGGAEKILSVLAVTLAATFAALNVGKIADAAKKFSTLAKSIGAAGGKAFAVFGIILLLILLIQDFIAFMKGDNSLIGTIFDKAGIGADNARNTILNVWNTVKDFLLDVWNAIKGAAQAIFGELSEWWAENGDSVMESFSKIWESIKSFCETLWNAISNHAHKVFGALRQFWNTWGDTIISVFSTIWNTLVSLIQPFLDAIAAVIDFLTSVFTGDWQGAWNAVRDFFASVWQIITTIISNAFQIVTAIWGKAAEIFSGIFQNIWNAVTEKVTGIKDAIVNGFMAAIDWIKSLPSQAIQWGADIIQGIVDGITSKIQGIGEAASGIAGKIASFLHFSEPDEGPLSDFHTYMPDMIDLMSKGITAGREKVRKALQGVTGDMSVMARANIVDGRTAQSVSRSCVSSRTVTQNVNITNQFNGDRAGQEKSSDAMEKASDDATSRMARALAFAK